MSPVSDSRFTSLSDRELVDAVVRGDPEAGDAFVDRYARFVSSILTQAGVRRRDVDDLFQAVFAKLWEGRCRRLRLWRGDDGFHHFLAPIVRFAVADFYRRGRREWPLEAGADPPDDAPDPRSGLLEGERREALLKVAQELQPRDRAILQAVLSGEDGHDAAMSLELTDNAYYQAVYQLKKRLARRLVTLYPELFGGDHD